MLFPPAPLPCRPYELRPAAADARDSRRTESSRCGSLLPPPLRGTSALLPPPLRGAAASHDRQHGAEETRELAYRPEEEGCSPASSLPGTCFAACVRLAAPSRLASFCFRIRGVPLCLIRLPCVRVSAGSSPGLVHPDPSSRRRRDGRRSAAPT